jgi:hypothetical protein
MHADPEDTGPGHERDGKVLANLVIVGMLVLFGAAVVINHDVRNPVLDGIKPVVFAVGVPQPWAVFAPPRKASSFVDVRTERADGSSVEWRLPAGHLGVWDFADYHWKQYSDYVRARRHSQQWEPLARYVAGQDFALGNQPTEVTLSTTSAALRPPGEQPAEGRWRSRPFYTLRLDPPASK